MLRAVGIKQLKARLSEYVRLARTGETILITHRHEVVAQLGPSRHRPPPAGSLDEILDEMARQGLLTRAALPKGDWTWKSSGLGLPSGTATTILDDLREDRV